MTKRTGGCHCRNISVEFDTEIEPTEFEPRACQCSFCRQHQSRAVTDPNGKLSIQVRDANQLNRYEFALKTIQFLVCRNCGVYVAGFMPDPSDSEAYGTLMISALDDRNGFLAPIAKDYDDQPAEDRTARRRNVWTPATLTIKS